MNKMKLTVIMMALSFMVLSVSNGYAQDKKAAVKPKTEQKKGEKKKNYGAAGNVVDQTEIDYLYKAINHVGKVPQGVKTVTINGKELKIGQITDKETGDAITTMLHNSGKKKPAEPAKKPKAK